MCPHLTLLLLWADSCARRQGLRTLAVGSRFMDEEAYNDWDGQFQEAAALLDGRDEAIDKLIAEVGI